MSWLEIIFAIAIALPLWIGVIQRIGLDMLAQNNEHNQGVIINLLKELQQ